ncbi:MAG: YlbF family regulator [Chloroflexi bacterium]|nr:YlbF family regulator [Chloroflexota bacterium]
MELSDEIIQAARELGEALHHHSIVQEHLQAVEAVEQSAELAQLEQAIQDRYRDLVQRQQAGQIVFPQEVNQFYRLQDEMLRNPMIEQRAESLKNVKTLFEAAASSISSILTIDFVSIAGEDD